MDSQFVTWYICNWCKKGYFEIVSIRSRPFSCPNCGATLVFDKMVSKLRKIEFFVGGFGAISVMIIIFVSKLRLELESATQGQSDVHGVTKEKE